MDSKMTVEQVEKIRRDVGETYAFTPPWRDKFNAALDLAKLALSPPQDVAGLCEELRAYRPDDGNHWKAPNVCTQAADAILSLSARNRELENEKHFEGELYGELQRRDEAIIWKDRRITELEAALQLAEKSEHEHMNCQDCDGEGEAELCETCFPAADKARLARWAALKISPPDATILPFRRAANLQGNGNE